MNTLSVTLPRRSNDVEEHRTACYIRPPRGSPLLAHRADPPVRDGAPLTQFAVGLGTKGDGRLEPRRTGHHPEPTVNRHAPRARPAGRRPAPAGSQLEAERLTAGLSALHEEARQLRGDAERDHAEALRARKQADEILAGASQEAAAIVLDANEQASLLMGSAQVRATSRSRLARQEAERAADPGPCRGDRPACRGPGAPRPRHPGGGRTLVRGPRRGGGHGCCRDAARHRDRRAGPRRRPAAPRLGRGRVRVPARGRVARGRADAARGHRARRAACRTESAAEAQHTRPLADTALAAARAESEDKSGSRPSRPSGPPATVRRCSAARPPRPRPSAAPAISMSAPMSSRTAQPQDTSAASPTERPPSCSLDQDRAEDITHIPAWPPARWRARPRPAASGPRRTPPGSLRMSPTRASVRSSGSSGAARRRRPAPPACVPLTPRRSRGCAKRRQRPCAAPARRDSPTSRRGGPRSTSCARARRALERARAEAAEAAGAARVIAGGLGELSGVIEALSEPERDPAVRPEPEAVPPPPEDADLPPTGASDPLPAPPRPLAG